MFPLHPFFCIVVFTIAFTTAYCINLLLKPSQLNERYQTIDGLRGFLAIGVFIHHATIWHQYINTGIWEAPKSNLYNHLGQTSVAFFFMITSFLFVTKLINSKEKEFNWKAFYISRIFRLVPMYYVSLCLLILYVMIKSDWQLQVGISSFLASLFHWFAFTITTNPYINNSEFTIFINGGVVWSLPFEWLFYFSLPLISLFILKAKPNRFYIALGFVFITTYMIVHGIQFRYILTFAGGAIAPFIIKYGKYKIKFESNLISCLILICLFLIIQFESTDNVFCKLVITIIFTLIALGNTLFGVLKSKSLQILGTISYSTYLLHGLLLFTVFYFGFGIEKTKQYTPFEYCLVIFLMTPILVLISFLGYKYIEKPFIEIAKRLTKKLELK